MWGILFLFVVFLPGICLLCFLCFGVLPLIPCPWSLSLRVFTRKVLFLLSLVASCWVGDLSALVAGVFLGGCPVPLSPFLVSGDASVFRLYSPLLFSVGISSGFCGLCFGRAPIVSLSGSSAVLLSCCFFSFLSLFPLSLSTLSFSLPFSACLWFLLPCCPGGSNFFSLSLPSFCSLLVLLFCLFLSVFTSSFFPSCVWGAWVGGTLVFLLSAPLLSLLVAHS